MSPAEWHIAASRLVEDLRKEPPGDAAAKLRTLVELAEAEIKLHEGRLNLPAQLLGTIAALTDAGEEPTAHAVLIRARQQEFGSREAIRSALSDLIGRGKIIFTLEGRLRIAGKKK